MNRLTWKRELDGFTDVGLHDGVTEGDAICRLADIEVVLGKTYDLDHIRNMAKEIELLQGRLDNAEQCIYSIEDALDRGADNDWARSAIAEYEETLKEV